MKQNKDPDSICHFLFGVDQDLAPGSNLLFFYYLQTEKSIISQNRRNRQGQQILLKNLSLIMYLLGTYCLFLISKYFFRIRIRNPEIMDLDSGGQEITALAGLIRILYFLAIEKMCCQICSKPLKLKKNFFLNLDK